MYNRVYYTMRQTFKQIKYNRYSNKRSFSSRLFRIQSNKNNDPNKKPDNNNQWIIGFCVSVGLYLFNNPPECENGYSYYMPPL